MNASAATEMGLVDTLRSDYNAFLGLDLEQERSLVRRQFDALTLPGFWAVVLYRFASRLHSKGLTPPARLLTIVSIALFTCELSPRLRAGPGLVIPHPQGVAIGAGVVLGSNVRLLRGVGMGTAGYRDKTRDGWPVIGDDCVVCDGAKVFGPVHVGCGSTIGTSVVLFESVPAGSVVTLRQELDIRTDGVNLEAVEYGS